MNDPLNIRPAHDDLDASERIDLLVSKIADNEADERDWAAFNGLAEAVPGAWKQLAQTQRDNAALSLTVGLALHAADHVEIPHPHLDSTDAFRAPDRIHTWSRISSARAWGGWAVAAALVLAWAGGLNPRASLGPSNIAGVSPPPAPKTADEALNLYYKLGQKEDRVIQEVPERVLVRSCQAPHGGGIEVVYVRQIMERAILNDLVGFEGRDELGRPVPIPANVSIRSAGPQ